MRFGSEQRFCEKRFGKCLLKREEFILMEMEKRRERERNKGRQEKLTQRDKDRNDMNIRKSELTSKPYAKIHR